MKKLDCDGNMNPYPPERMMNDDEQWIIGHPASEEPNLVCDCGSESFRVSWWDYPYTGGYCRVVCAECGESLVLIDDFA